MRLLCTRAALQKHDRVFSSELVKQSRSAHAKQNNHQLTKGASTLGAQALQIVATTPPAKFSRPQIVARPPNLAVLLTHCGQLILRKISKFDATRF